MNEQLYLNNLAKIDPSLWRVKASLLHNNVNPDVLPPVIEAIAHVYHATRYGDIIITMENGVITVTKGVASRKVEISVE